MIIQIVHKDDEHVYSAKEDGNDYVTIKAVDLVWLALNQEAVKNAISEQWR